jgi:hypothetical protein
MSPPEPQIPTEFPPSITAGTTFKIDRGFSEWPNDSWKYTLILAGAAPTLAKDATADPASKSTYHVVLTPTDTQALNPSGGATQYYRYVERMTALDSSGEKWDVGQGVLAVDPNLAITQPGDALSDDEKILAAIKQVLSGRVTADIESYSIAGRSIAKIPIRELQELEGFYTTRVWRQHNPGVFSHPVDVQFPPTDFPAKGRTA